MGLHDVRFVEDDWESPTLGAWGLGWECWCDGMEVSQFTYFQQVAGFECAPVSGELTYGLERLAMYVQGVDSIYDINFNGGDGAERVTYGDVFKQAEEEYSRFNFEHADTAILFQHFKDAEAECRSLLGARRLRRAPPDGAARLRPVHQGEPRLQPSRRARRDLGHRAPELHPSSARTRQGLRRRLAQDRGRGSGRTALIRRFAPPSPASGRRERAPLPFTGEGRGEGKSNACLSSFRLIEMPDLLLELFSEEIPARMQRQAAEDLKRLVTNALVDRNLIYEGAQAFVTPRRLALHVVGLPAAQPDLREERKGPRVGAPEAAIQGFLKSAGLARIEDARIEKDPKKGEFYVAVDQEARPRDQGGARRDHPRDRPLLPLAEVDALGRSALLSASSA